MKQDNHRKIQYFGDPLAANYTWDNPFQTTSKDHCPDGHGLRPFAHPTYLPLLPPTR